MNVFSYVCLLPFVYTRDSHSVQPGSRPLFEAYIRLPLGCGVGSELARACPHAPKTTPYPKHRFTTTERDRRLGKGHRNGTELGHLCISRGLAPTLSFFLSIAFRLLVNILVTSESGSGHYSDCLLTHRRKPTNQKSPSLLYFCSSCWIKNGSNISNSKGIT
jgi:hypothetical protein